LKLGSYYEKSIRTSKGKEKATDNKNSVRQIGSSSAQSTILTQQDTLFLSNIPQTQLTIYHPMLSYPAAGEQNE
ncbi:4052_t:CDS:1, partial [Racocetra fulgida]